MNEAMLSTKFKHSSTLDGSPGSILFGCKLERPPPVELYRQYKQENEITNLHCRCDGGGHKFA
ncbi:hypothetical protein DERP_002825 [Dermatophagoides pteronyssinus]|uniref:Uncharacterized protein n=1 Tax=Dermatophagoides pteronyssinus TaxID=6956 RepID=A0ABQ8JVU4_DERPT|nr:hypothetical protein DERP_002825 [Dermatophagoides pteronyssinus]